MALFTQWKMDCLSMDKASRMYRISALPSPFVCNGLGLNMFLNSVDIRLPTL